MKTRWQFCYLATSFRFGRPIKYKVSTALATAEANPAPDFANEFFVEIEPADKPIRVEADETGHFNLVFDGTPEETKEFAHWAAYDLSRRIAFEHGPMDLMSGFVTWERIPENDEERELVGDKPFGAELHLEEVLEPPKFDPKSIENLSTDPESARLMAQFVEARRARAPVDQFLGLFRILEYSYEGHRGNDQLEYAMLASESLRAHVVANTSQADSGEPITEEQLRRLIRDLIVTRHKCAHLQKKFGIAHCDEEMASVVRPLVPLVEDLAKAAIGERLSGKQPPLSGGQ